MGRLSCLEVAQVPEIGFPVEVVEGVPVVTAPEEIDITNAAGLRAAVSEAVGSGLCPGHSGHVRDQVL